MNVGKSKCADESFKEEEITISNGGRANFNEILDKCVSVLENLVMDEARNVFDMRITQEAVQQPLASIVDRTNPDSQSGITELCDRSLAGELNGGPHTCVELVESPLAKSKKTVTNEFLDQYFKALEEMHQSTHNEEEKNQADEKTMGRIEGGEKKGDTEKNVEHKHDAKEDDTNKNVPEKGGGNINGKKNDANKDGNNKNDGGKNSGKRFQVHLL